MNVLMSRHALYGGNIKKTKIEDELVGKFYTLTLPCAAGDYLII